MIKFNDDKYLENLDFVMINKKTRIKKIFFIFSLSLLLLLCEDKATRNPIELEIISSKLVFVKWKEKEKVDLYEVSRIIDGSNELLALFPSSITFYPDGGVQPGKKYCWEVKAKSSEGEVKVGKACAEIPKGKQEMLPPFPPSNLKLHIIDSGSNKIKIRLEWQKYDEGKYEGIGFKILKNIHNKFVAIGITPFSVTSFEIEEKEGGEHCYRVISYGVGGDSEFFIDEVCLNCFKGYYDNDGDGYGSEEILKCDFKFPEGATFKPADIATTSGDCDDKNPKINPGVPDLQDGIDNDCDGKVDDDRKIQVEYVCPLTFPRCNGINDDSPLIDENIDDWSELYLTTEEQGEFLISCLKPTNFQFSSTYIYTYETSCSVYREKEYSTGNRKVLHVALNSGVLCKSIYFKDIIYPTRVTILYYKITSENQLRCFSGDEVKVDFSKKFILAIGLYNERWYYRSDRDFVRKIYYKDGNLYIHIAAYIRGGNYPFYWEKEFPAPPYTDWDFIILEREYLDTPIIFVYHPCLCSNPPWTCGFVPPCYCGGKTPNEEETVCEMSSIYQTQILEK